MNKELVLSRAIYSNNTATFLGKWCFTSFELQESKKKILEYHWDDKDKLDSDFCLIKKHYPYILAIIADKLNNIHGECNTREYWEVVLGPWLITILAVIYDRWKVVDSIKENKIFYYAAPLNELFHVPYDYQEFTQCITSDVWNHCIFSELLKTTSIECRQMSTQNINDLIKFKLVFKNVYKKSVILFKGKNSLLLNTSIGVKNYIKLSYLFKEFIFPSKKVATFLKSNIDKIFRRSLLVNTNNKYNIDPFDYLLKNLDLFLPRIYLEDYKKAKVENIFNHLSNGINKIYSETSHISDDFFKIWLANRLKLDAKLFIFQHGGSNSEKINLLQEHEKKISDMYFLWGGSLDENCTLLGSYKMSRYINKFKFKFKKNKLLLVSSQVPKYFSQPISIPISGQIAIDYQEQCNFLSKLDKEIVKKTVVRINPHEFGWGQEVFFRNSFKNIVIDNASSLYDSLADTSLIVITYNGTTLLEAFLSEIPTVVILNKYNDQVNEIYDELFSSLKDANILFNSYIEASTHINKIWSDIDLWWKSERTLEVRNLFIKEFIVDAKDINKRVFNSVNLIKNSNKYV